MCKFSVNGHAKGEGSDSISHCPELAFTLVLACNAIGTVASTIDPVTTLRLVLDLYLGTHTHTHTHTHHHTTTTTTYKKDTYNRDPLCLAGLAGPDWLHEWHTHTYTCPTHTHTRAYSAGKCTKASTNMHSK